MTAVNDYDQTMTHYSVIFEGYNQLHYNALFSPSLSLSLQIGVVDETRPYPKWSGAGQKGDIDLNTGIMAAQLELNTLHKILADQGFSQVHM